MFGDDIKNIRKEYNLTQVELAEFFGVHINTVQSWEYKQKAPSKQTQQLYLKSLLKYAKERA